MSIWSSVHGTVVLNKEYRISVRDLIELHLGDDEVVSFIDRIDINTVKFGVRVCMDGSWASETLTSFCEALRKECHSVEIEMRVRW